jgi:hypothetical protein
MNSKRLKWELGHQVEHNPFNEWRKFESKLGSHPQHHNAYINSQIFGWKFGGH